MIVGRDTQALSEIGVTKAAVETVAENSSDGIIAPMLYMAIGGISHLRDTGSVQLCFELLDYDLTLNISILEVPVAIGAMPCTLEGRALQPEVVVVCNGDASIILGHDLLSLVESIKVSLGIGNLGLINSGVESLAVVF